MHASLQKAPGLLSWPHCSCQARSLCCFSRACCSALASSLHESFPLTSLLADTPQLTRGLNQICFVSGPLGFALHPYVTWLPLASRRCVTGPSLVPALYRFSGPAEIQARKTEINRNRSRGRGGARSRPTGTPTIKIVSFRL